jgi:hypothetical protein
MSLQHLPDRDVRCSNVRCAERDRKPLYVVIVGWRTVPGEPPFVQVVLCKGCAESWDIHDKAPIVEVTS